MNNIELANDDQLAVLEAAYNWWHYQPNNMLFQYEGGPGTGKTWLAEKIRSAIGIDRGKVAPAAYTGAAAIVLRTKGFSNARTDHSWLYKPVDKYKYDAKGNIMKDAYFDLPISEMGFTPKPLEGIELMFIDEAPMTPMYIRKEIESRGVRVIACGDLKQLPPIESQPGYLVDGEIHHLTQIMRQDEDNPIIWISNRLYNGLPIHKGLYSSKSGSVLVIEEDEVTDNMIAWSDIMICGTNKTREALNKRARRDILHIQSDLPQHGERLVCRKNDWNKEVDGISLANGLIGRVTDYPDVSQFDGKSYTVDFCPMIMDTGFTSLQCNYNFLTCTPEQKNYIKNNPKYNPGAMLEFAYSITTHVSQGSEHANGMYFKEYLSKEINGNLDYTGVTRFKNSCIIVLPKRKYY